MRKKTALIIALFFINLAFLSASENSKKGGISIKPFPLLAYDADTGLGYGLSVTLFGYEKGSSDYKWKIYSEYYATTGGEMQPANLFDTNPLGVSGGTVLSLLGGLIFDSRDFTPNPHAGSYNELFLETTIAGNYDYSRLTIKHSFYWQPFKTKKLVLAERIMIDQLLGDAPFFKAEMIGGTQRTYAQGGKDSIRGMPRFRFLNDFKVVISPEIRWNFLKLGRFLGDEWHLEFVLFSDIGGSWKNPNDFNSSEIQIGYGAGLRVFWGKDFIISIDFGFWEEESGLYVGFDQQF